MTPHIWIPKRDIIQPHIPLFPSRRAIEHAYCLPAASQNAMIGSKPPSATGGFPAPTAFWRLEDATDSGPNSLGLTDHGTVTYGAGHLSNCATFGAGPKYLTRADDTHLRGGTGVAISMAFWINWPATPTGAWRVGGTSDGVSNNYFMTGLGHTAGQPYNIDWRCNDPANGVGIVAISTTLTIATWHFVVVTFDPTLTAPNNMGVSVDGAALSFPSASINVNSIQNLACAFALGNRADGLFTGLTYSLDAFGFWQGHALTNTEITDLYNGGAGKEYYSGSWH